MLFFRLFSNIILLFIIFLYTIKINSFCCEKCSKGYNNNKNLKYKEIQDIDKDKKEDNIDKDKKENNKDKKEDKYDEIEDNLLKKLEDIDKKTNDKEYKCEDINEDIILQKLNINKTLIDNIKSCGSIEKKIKTILDNCNDIYEDTVYDYLPRCIIAHKDNNCSLESHFHILLHNPWFIKFFYLLYHCCNDYINSRCPLALTICELVVEALKKPNFNDIIDAEICCNISKKFFEKYKNESINEDYCSKHYYKSFQDINYFSHHIILTVEKEIKYAKTINFLYPFLDVDINNINHYVDIFVEKKKMNCSYFDEISSKNIYTLPFRDILYAKFEYHFKAYKYINGYWYNYDSLVYEHPKKISNKELIFETLLEKKKKNKDVIRIYPSLNIFENCTEEFDFLKTIYMNNKNSIKIV